MHITHNGNEYHMGWKYDPKAIEDFMKTLPIPYFHELTHLKDSGVNVDVFDWEDETVAFGNPLPPWDQSSIGSCVSHGGGRTAQGVLVSQIVAKQSVWPGFQVAREPIYGGSRCEIGGQYGDYQDGSTGSWCSDWLTKYGLVLYTKYAKVDLTDGYSVSRCKEWGAKGAKPVEEDAKKHPIKGSTCVTTPESARDAIANKFFINICGSASRTMQREANGFCPKVGENWGHSQNLCGVGIAKGNIPFVAYRNSWGCFDSVTEVLTDSGWKLFRDVDIKIDEIATLNLETEELEYNFAEAYHEYDYFGDLYQYSSNFIDLCVTPNHNLLINSSNCNRDKTKWELIKAEDAPINYLMKKDANWTGLEKEFYSCGKYTIKMDEWLEFLGYFIAEGSCTQRSRVKVMSNGEEERIKEDRYITCIYQNDGTEKSNKIQELLNKLPIKVTKVKNGWSISNTDFGRELKVLGKSYEKHIPSYAKNISKRQCKVLFDAMRLGDGTVVKSKNSEHYVYYTSSKLLAGDVQELSLKCGYAADIVCIDRIGAKAPNGTRRHLEYQVKIKTQRLETMPDGGFIPTKVSYSGKVYCLTVPNHTMYVRRNGKAVWSGNSYLGDTNNKVTLESGKEITLPGGVYLSTFDDIRTDLKQGDSFAYDHVLGWENPNPNPGPNPPPGPFTPLDWYI